MVTCSQLVFVTRPFSLAVPQYSTSPAMTFHGWVTQIFILAGQAETWLDLPKMGPCGVLLPLFTESDCAVQGQPAFQTCLPSIPLKEHPVGNPDPWPPAEQPALLLLLLFEEFQRTQGHALGLFCFGWSPGRISRGLVSETFSVLVVVVLVGLVASGRWRWVFRLIRSLCF